MPGSRDPNGVGAGSVARISALTSALRRALRRHDRASGTRIPAGARSAARRRRRRAVAPAPRARAVWLVQPRRAATGIRLGRSPRCNAEPRPPQATPRAGPAAATPSKAQTPSRCRRRGSWRSPRSDRSPRRAAVASAPGGARLAGCAPARIPRRRHGGQPTRPRRRRSEERDAAACLERSDPIGQAQILSTFSSIVASSTAPARTAATSASPTDLPVPASPDPAPLAPSPPSIGSQTNRTSPRRRSPTSV